MNRLARITLLALPLLSACSEPSADLTCEACDIQLQYLATVGDDGDGPGALPSYPTSIARDSKGRYFVTAPYSGEERPYLFDASGTFVSRLGGIGEGPREFQSAMFLSVSEDSILVYDRWQGRIAVYTPELSYVRSTPGVLALYRWVELADGTLVANRNDGRLPPLVRLDRKGVILNEFGSVYEKFDPSTWLRPVRYLAPSSSGGVWSIQFAFSSEVREWSEDGTLLRVLAVEMPWYEPHEQPVNPSPDAAPQSRIMGIWEDEAGLLWIAGMAAAANWSEGLGKPRTIEGHEVYEILDPDLVYDTVLEVVDPDAAEPTLYRRRLEEGLLWPVQPGVLASVDETDLGFYRVEVYAASLRQP